MRFSTRILAATIFALSSFAIVSCGGGAEQVQSNVALDVENTGPWQLNRDESGMSFVTVKKGSLAEIGTFMSLDGKVAEDGAAEFTIVIDSINTNNETRDPRMRQYLFETDKHPYITVKAAIDFGRYSDMEMGERRTTLLSYDLDLHGMSEARESYVMVTRLGPNKVLIENKAPVLVDAADFGLEAGVEKLRELASLESITPVVPVTFSLVFER